MQRAKMFTVLLAVPAALLALFLCLPVVAMVSKERPGSVWGVFYEAQVRGALAVSVGGAAISTCIALCLGVPLAYLLARHDFFGKAVVLAVVDLPVVVPHMAAGIALLTVLGPNGAFGRIASAGGIEFVDALWGTVAAMLFVSAPFAINAARAGFEAVDSRLEKASRGLGASALRTFFSVSLPLASGAIISGAIMSWARAVSEFGAVLVIAYYPLAGPTLIYERFTSFGLKAARPVAVLLVLVSMVVFVTFRVRWWRRSARAGGGANA